MSYSMGKILCRVNSQFIRIAAGEDSCFPDFCDAVNFCLDSGAGGYTFSTGLTNVAGTVTSNISTGIAGGQTIYGGVAASENLTIHSTSHATKGFVYIGTWAGFDGANQRLGLLTLLPTHTLTFGTGSTGIALYNTADQTTNYERLVIQWTSNVAFIAFQGAGSATGRTMRLSASSATGGSASNINITRTSLPFYAFDFTTALTSTAGSILSLFTTSSSTTAASGAITFVSIAPTINQSSTAGFTTFVINPTLTAQGSGLQLLQDWQTGGTSLAVMSSLGYLGLKTTAPTHNLTHGSTSTGIAYYNTADQTTNFERVRMQWSGNIFKIASGAGGSGSARVIRILSNSSNADADTSISYVEVGGSNVTLFTRSSPSVLGAGNGVIVMTSGSYSNSSGTGQFVAISPVLAQTGTAGWTMLDLNPQIGSEGSGAKYFLICRKSSGSNVFSIDDTGITYAAGGITQRVVTTANNATATINVLITDQYELTAMSADTTISTSGTGTAGQRLRIRLKDNGTTRALTWNAIFRAIGVTLPTGTTPNKTTYIGAIYNATDTKWDVVAVTTEA